MMRRRRPPPSPMDAPRSRTLPKVSLIEPAIHCLLEAVRTHSLAGRKPNEFLLRLCSVNGTHQLRRALDATTVPTLSKPRTEWCVTGNHKEKEGTASRK